MTQQQQQAPFPSIVEPVPVRPGNKIGTAGFFLGLIGLVLAPILVTRIVAWPLVVAGLILSVIGISRARKANATKKGLSIAGVVLSALGLTICLMWTVVFDDVVEEMQRVAQFSYEVTGDAQDVAISYGGEPLKTTTDTAPALPWRADGQANGLFKGGKLTATAGPDGGSVTCKIILDGKVISTNTASGAGGVATCTGG